MLYGDSPLPTMTTEICTVYHQYCMNMDRKTVCYDFPKDTSGRIFNIISPVIFGEGKKYL